MKIKRSLMGLVVAIALLLGLAASTAAHAKVECYPCTQCDGKYCFIYDSHGNLIGTIGNSCCTGSY